MEKELENIEMELDKLGEEKSKGGPIAMIAVGGGSAITGFGLALAGLIYALVGRGLNEYLTPEEYPIDLISPIGIALLIIGSILLVVGVVLLIVGTTNLRKVVEHNRRVESLLNKRNRILEESKPKALEEKKESNNKQVASDDEDTLLRLLSEGKISVEEYKKLSKKK